MQKKFTDYWIFLNSKENPNLLTTKGGLFSFIFACARPLYAGDKDIWG